jgi:STE24 endopeptidase
MTPEQLAEARQYGRQKLVLELIDKALDIAVLAIFAVWLVRPLDAWLAERVPSASLRVLAIFGVLVGLHALLSLPLAFVSGYVLEHRYGLSQQSMPRWFWRQLKQLFLALMLGAVLVWGLYALIWWIGPYWWLAAACAFFVVSVVLGQWAPVLILPLFYKIERLDDPQLTARIARLVAGTGLSIEGVYRLVLSSETVKANAMLAGLGRTRRVLLGDTLLDRFSPDEIEVVLAHEVGHHVFRHIPKLMAAGFAFSLIGFWITDRLLALWLGSAYQPHNLPPAALPALLLGLAVFGLLMEPLQNALSRYFERQCDRYALQVTGLKSAYVSAFRKLAQLNKDDPAPPRWEVLLFHSHPPIEERLALAEQ